MYIYGVGKGMLNGQFKDIYFNHVGTFRSKPFDKAARLSSRVVSHIFSCYLFLSYARFQSVQNAKSLTDNIPLDGKPRNSSPLRVKIVRQRRRRRGQRRIRAIRQLHERDRPGGEVIAIGHVCVVGMVVVARV